MIKKGDKVRVTRKPNEKELSLWANDWIEEMDEAVNKSYFVLSTEMHQAELSFQPFGSIRKIGFGFDFPYCVLEKVEE